MPEKFWINCPLNINGLELDAKFTKNAVDNIFKPFLRKLTEIQGMMDRKIVAYLAAPPAAGKTTLAQYLEKLSREDPVFTNVRALGMDGFHYDSAYLKANKILRDGVEILMNDIKGAPETFDVDTMQIKLREVRQEGTNWNAYDRIIHDVVHDALSVEDDIVLVEGNYLLLDEPRWTNIRVLADYTVFVKADPAYLKDRLIFRKMKSGLTREQAENFYVNSDSKNVIRVLENSAHANETWALLPDGDYAKIDDEEEDFDSVVFEPDEGEA
ncbi:MAG: nucleoside/nucleotide kinase family protein [Selenomonadaceae bacterium]|nr:nucleoside/nucleotide kinase family protein [Selenomonadaceae bacterium]